MFKKKPTKGTPPAPQAAPPNQWVKQALGGTYDYHTGGGGKKGKKPGFSKGGSITAQQDKMRKGMAPTHGTDGSC